MTTLLAHFTPLTPDSAPFTAGGSPGWGCVAIAGSRTARQTIIWRAVGGMGRGSLVDPERYASTPAAQALPSAMAQTINDWPRPASPQAKTPSTSVAVVVARDVAALVQGNAELRHDSVGLGSDEAHRQQYELGGNLALSALDRRELAPWNVTRRS